MTFDEYNSEIDEVTAMRAMAYSLLEEAEIKRLSVTDRARSFIRTKLGEDSLHVGQSETVGSIPTFLIKIELAERGSHELSGGAD